MWALHGLLPPVVGAPLSTVLDALSSPRPAADGTPDPDCPRPAARGRAGPGGPGSWPPGPATPRRCPLGVGHRPGCIAMADLATLSADLTVRGAQTGVPMGQLEVGDGQGWDISPLSVQTLACDAEMIPVLMDGQGRALDVGSDDLPVPAPDPDRDRGPGPALHLARMHGQERPGATPTTSPRSGSAGPPARPTGPCCAGPTTATSTTKATPDASSTATSCGHPTPATHPRRNAQTKTATSTARRAIQRGTTTLRPRPTRPRPTMAPTHPPTTRHRLAPEAIAA